MSYQRFPILHSANGHPAEQLFVASADDLAAVHAEYATGVLPAPTVLGPPSRIEISQPSERERRLHRQARDQEHRARRHLYPPSTVVHAEPRPRQLPDCLTCGDEGGLWVRPGNDPQVEVPIACPDCNHETRIVA